MGAGETQDPRLRAPRLRAPGPGRHSLRFCRCQRFICNKQRDCPRLGTVSRSLSLPGISVGIGHGQGLTESRRPGHCGGVWGNPHLGPPPRMVRPRAEDSATLCHAQRHSPWEVPRGARK